LLFITKFNPEIRIRFVARSIYYRKNLTQLIFSTQKFILTIAYAFVPVNFLRALISFFLLAAFLFPSLQSLMRNLCLIVLKIGFTKKNQDSALAFIKFNFYLLFLTNRGMFLTMNTLNAVARAYFGVLGVFFAQFVFFYKNYWLLFTRFFSSSRPVCLLRAAATLALPKR
jgi:hypothetical protein